MLCPDPETLVESAIDLILTQYRESPNLLALARAHLREPADAALVVCQILDHFDLDTAVADQLTIIGKWMGWPRCHCAGRLRTVFGFACEPIHRVVIADGLGGFIANCSVEDEGEGEGEGGEGEGEGDDGEDSDVECDYPFEWDGTPLCEIDARPVSGFCDGAYWECGVPEFEEFCFEDDELYRSFLKARRVQMTRDWRRNSLVEALQLVYGDNAMIVQEMPGKITVSAGRELSGGEAATKHLIRHVMPIAPGIELTVIGQLEDVPWFGFGAGWGGVCEGFWLG